MSRFILGCFFLTTPLFATTYDVGPGQALTTVGQVPWATLAPGDVVRIHWQAQPYREKWVLDRRGTAAQPIVVQGVPGPNGELPVISGENATTPAPLNFWNEERAVLKIGGSNVPADDLPAYLVIEGLEFRSARPPYTFTDDGGTLRTYATNAAPIFVEKAEHLVIRGCTIRDGGNGLFVAASDGATQDLSIENNFILDNGIVGSGFEHNTYTAARGIVYQGNRFGPLRAGAGGNNLKDRSAGLVVRYNWIEGGNRQLDLVDAEDSQAIVEDPRYSVTHVYGNVLIEPDGAGNSQILHYGGDSGNTAIYRKGVLHFYNNTVVSERAGNTTLMRLSTSDERADVRNNLLFVTATGNRLALVDADGVVDLSHNWMKSGWVASHSGLAGVLHDDGTTVSATTPGFVDPATQDYRLAVGSTAVDAGTSLTASVLPANDLARQYTRHQATEGRFRDALFDLGAFERCVTSASCGVLFLDGFEAGNTAAWSLAVP